MVVCFSFNNLCMTGVIGGAVGPAMKKFFLGLFGIMAYIIPICGLAYMGYTKLVNNKPVLPAFKISACSGLVILGTLLSFFAKVSFSDLLLLTEGRWKALYEAGSGGGAVFGMIGLLFFRIFGKGGSIAILILLCLVCLVFMLGDNIFIIVDAIRTRIEYFREGVENYEGFTESDEDKEERRERIERREKRNREMFFDRQERRKENAKRREEEKNAWLEKKKADLELAEQMKKEEALKKGYRDAIEFGPYLIVNGKRSFIKGNGGWGIAPRTAIGQREDGIVLFLVINGRLADSIGADMVDLTDIMENYGAINAANLDGGSSSELVIKNKIINKPVAGGEKGLRNMPTFWIVK